MRLNLVHALKSVGVNCKDLDLNECTYAKCETYYKNCVGAKEECRAAFNQQCTPGGKPGKNDDCKLHQKQCEGEGLVIKSCHGVSVNLDHIAPKLSS